MFQPQLDFSEPQDESERQAEEIAAALVTPQASAMVETGERLEGSTEPVAAAIGAERVYRQAAGGAPSTMMQNMENRIVSLPFGGEPLDTPTRAYFEPRFGADFGAVRVHVGTEAANAAASVRALAFTYGRDIVFGQGRYSPETSVGRRLLAHELVHVLQQNSSGEVRRKLAKPGARSRPGAKSFEFAVMVSEVWRQGDDDQSWTYRVFKKYLHEDIGTTSASEEARLLVLMQTFHTEKLLAKPVVGKTYSLGVSPSVHAAIRELHQREVRREERREKGPATKEEAGLIIPSVADVEAQPPETMAPIEAHETLLSKDSKLSELYLEMMEHFGGVTVTPAIREMAKTGLDRKALTIIVGNNPERRNLTDLFTQEAAWYRAAGGGDDLIRFSNMIETILEQYTRGNPTAQANQLAIGRGQPITVDGPKDSWGIFYRPSWWMYYDEFGQPLPGPAGMAVFDRGYVGATPPTHGINIAKISDPAIREFFNELRLLFGDPARMMIEGSQKLGENLELVKAVVLAGLEKRVVEKFVGMLPSLVGFMIGRGLASILSRNPETAPLGLALYLLLEAAGYVFDIQFGAQLMQNLELAAYHVSRLRRNARGELTDLSQRHVLLAAKPLQDIISDLALLAGMKAFGSLLEALGKKKAVEIECESPCEIKDLGEPESGTQLEKRLLLEDIRRGRPETPQRFTLTEPAAKGDPGNSFARIAKELAARVEAAKKSGKPDPLPRLRPDVLEGDALAFILKDPALKAEWMRILQMEQDPAKALRENKGLSLQTLMRAVRNLKDFEKGKIGAKRVDVADFLLDKLEARITDITFEPWDPFHNFKTLFYVRVMEALTGLNVGGQEYTGRPLQTPKAIP